MLLRHCDGSFWIRVLNDGGPLPHIKYAYRIKSIIIIVYIKNCPLISTLFYSKNFEKTVFTAQTFSVCDGVGRKNTSLDKLFCLTLIDCPGTTSDQAGKTSACQGCPNQKLCSSGAAKAPDPGNRDTRYRLDAWCNHYTEIANLFTLRGKGNTL